MRGITVLLRCASPDEVMQVLDSLYPRQYHPWIHFSPDDDPVLYIDLCASREMELLRLEGPLPFEPACVLFADVSGRHSGDAELRDFLAKLLSRLDGLTSDGYTDEWWTLDDIISGVEKEGHPFFDYRGWNQRGREEREAR